MKKLLTILIIISVVLTSAFAEGTTSNLDPSKNSDFSIVSYPFVKTSARVEAMGGAGLAVFSNQDSLWMNPASLGEKGLVWNVPNFSISFYNAKALIDTGIIDDAMHGSLGENPGDYIGNILQMYGLPGEQKIATIDMGLGVKWGRFAMATDVQINLNSFIHPTGAATDIKIIPQVDIAQSFGVGLRFFRDNSINFDVGLSARLALRGYFDSIKAKDFTDMMNQDNPDYMSLVMDRPLALGFAVPIDAGINVNFPFGFSLGAVARNMNGIYYMTVADKGMNGMNGVGDYFGTAFDLDGFKITTPWSLDLGFGWTPDYKLQWIGDITLAADFVDVVGFFKDMSLSNMWLHTRFGAEIELLKVFEFRIGLNQGYATVGAGVNLFNVIHLEASYYTREFGAQLGDKPVDVLTIRANIGWER